MDNKSNSGLRRVGVGLDNVLSKFDERLTAWPLSANTDPFTAIKSEEFWAYLKPHEDIAQILEPYVDDYLIILTERPAKLRRVTDAWLKRHKIPHNEIIYSSIKRFDCRVHKIEVLLDTTFDQLMWFGLDAIQTVELKR